jgi:RNA polymerase sigma factor (sigma-70 family)
LYKADNREEYQRTRAEVKHVPLIDVIADLTGNAVEAYEEKQLLACLHEALQNLDEQDRELIAIIYYDGHTQQEAAEILNVSQKTVSKRHKKAIDKLRNSLIHWF